MNNVLSLKDMPQHEFRMWQMKMFENLVYFKNFCNEYHLRFFLSAGTCLGAVRHHGFIPWDDDMDVMMPREDYERLYDLWNKFADKTRFSCERSTKEKCISFPMTVVKNEATTCIYDHTQNLDISQGIKIDVEFLDGMPSSLFQRKLNEIYASLLALFRTQRLPNQRSSFKRFVSKILLFLIPSRTLRWDISVFCENRLKRYKFEECEFVRYLTVKPIHRSCLDKALLVDFEGEKMPIPQGYDEFLTALYGDYMKMPSENARFPKSNNLVFYDINNSYKQYKGIYYLNSK